MDYVSLLPPEIKKRRIDEKRQGKIVKLAVIVLAVVLAIYIFLLVSSLLTRNSLQSLQEERRDLEAQAAALQEYADLYEEMSETEDRLNRAMGTVPDWSEFMLDLAMALNPEGSLSELNLAYEATAVEENEDDDDDDEDAEENGTVNQGYFGMRGKSYSHGNVGDVLERIQELEQLSDVRCRISSETTLNNRPAVEFNVDARLLPGPVFFDPDGEGS